MHILWCTIFSSLPLQATLPDPHLFLNSLSLEQKIGQLFMVPVITDRAINTQFLEHTPYPMDHLYVESLITDYQVGGVIFLGSSSITSLHTMINRLQSLSTIPLLIGLDGEWGIAMRVYDAIKWPYALTLGALTDTTLVRTLGQMIGKEYKALGIHINFAPVADINTNADNPVIGYRSFGSCPDRVTRSCVALAQGLHDTGIISCAKHFPGHGDTVVDSHYTMPIITHNKDRLEHIELKPFTELITATIPALMTAHVAVPALDSTNRPASLSYSITTQLLKNKLGFTGLVITDGLGMQAVTAGKEPGHVELEALLAGNDILLCPVQVPQAIACIKQAIEDGRLSMAQLDATVLKILQAKAHVAKNTVTSLPISLTEQLHAPELYTLKATLFEHAITCVRDVHTILPLAPKQPIIHLQLGDRDAHTHFAHALEAQFEVTHVCADTDAEYNAMRENMHTTMPDDSPLIISVHGMSKYARDNYNITPALHALIKHLYSQYPRSVVVLFGNPYSTYLFPDAPCLLCGYEDEYEAHDAMVKIVSGSLVARGILPV